MVLPAGMIHLAIKSKTYEITPTGIRIDGQLYRWKNLKRIRVEGDYIIIERYYGPPIMLPKELRDAIALRSERDSLITNQ